MGLSVRDVRGAGLAASRGATDFGAYFTYFSFFIVVSALLLVVLFFRLGIEQRLRQIGVLRATGYTERHLRWMLSVEAAVIALALDGVRMVFSASDLPHPVPRFGPQFRDRPVIADGEVVYHGQPVAAVAAETVDIAEAAAALESPSCCGVRR